MSYAGASISELEALLSQCRLEVETTLMSESGEAKVGCVSIEAETTCKAVGLSMFLDVSMEGRCFPTSSGRLWCPVHNYFERTVGSCC